jgi:hypothetical protein
MKIISASRRTDIPAFYVEWLMNRIHEGFAGYSNPFNNKKYIVSLKKNDVAAIALWSKNFSPFINSSLILKDEGYTLFFNYTITGLPDIFETNCPDENESLESIKQLSTLFSPYHINWRYDPVLVTDITDTGYHINKFSKLCASLSGYVTRCYLSFPALYGKVTRNFKDFTENNSIRIYDLTIPGRIDLAEKLSVIAAKSGIEIYSCCGDYLCSEKIKKGHCIDGNVISSVSGVDLSRLKIRPTRKGCGCTESTDIGIYNICPHGCIYCYANVNIGKASDFYENYLNDDVYRKSAFLGTAKKVSDQWLEQIQKDKEAAEDEKRKKSIQPELF